MAQRKFLRQVAGYSSGDAGSFPRIILIDFFTDEEIRQQETARKYMTRLQENMKDLDEPCENQTDDKDSGHGESPTKKESKTNSEEREDTNLETNSDVHPHFENLESYDGPGSEFCVRLMCEHEQVMTFFPSMFMQNHMDIWFQIVVEYRYCLCPSNFSVAFSCLRIFQKFLV